MIINCFYEECRNYADIIYVPDILEDLEMVQASFFEWMFDKKVDHAYWVVVNNKKLYCQYGTQAFLEWLNNYKLTNVDEKAYLISENTSCWNKNARCLVF